MRNFTTDSLNSYNQWTSCICIGQNRNTFYHTRWKLCPLIKFLSHSLPSFSFRSLQPYNKVWSKLRSKEREMWIEVILCIFLGHKCKNVNCLNKDQVTIFDTFCSYVRSTTYINDRYYVFIHVNLKGILLKILQRCLTNFDELWIKKIEY